MNRQDLPPTVTPDELPPEAQRGLMARFRNYFLTGLIVAGPIAITLYLTWWFVTWVDGLVRPVHAGRLSAETYLPFPLPGFGLIIAIFALTLLGFLTANLVGRTLVDYGERLLDRMPVVRAIYRSLKQVFETLFSGHGLELPHGRPRRISMHPACGRSCSSRSRRATRCFAAFAGQEEHISVFLPCTPNPTTGFFFYVPKSKVIELEMTAEDAAKLIMSAGVIQPRRPIRRRSSQPLPAWPTPRASPMAPRCNRSRRRWSESDVFRHCAERSATNPSHLWMLCSLAITAISPPRSAAPPRRARTDRAAPQRLAALARRASDRASR